MPAEIRIRVNSSLFLRDPNDTELGRSLVARGIELIDELGFEKFTFKKLATAIHSTEASMYRYFESKHQFLGYILSWYWNWLSYLIETHTHNVTDPQRKLKIALHILTESVQDDPATSYINEAALHRIMMVESFKVYYAKDVDRQSKSALMEGFEKLCQHIADLIKEINPRYKCPRALASTMIISVQRQSFFALHHPALTELKTRGRDLQEIEEFIEHLALRVLQHTA